MAWTIRKTKKLGPFRFTFSKKGLGLSVGVKGARVGIAPTGETYTTIGRNGLYEKRILARGKKRSLQSQSTEPLQAAQPETLGHDPERRHTDERSNRAVRFGVGVAACILMILLIAAFVLFSRVR